MKETGLECLKRELRMRLLNRHSYGWGYRESDVKKYRDCQIKNNTYLFDLIKCIRELNLKKNWKE